MQIDLLRYVAKILSVALTLWFLLFLVLNLKVILIYCCFKMPSYLASKTQQKKKLARKIFSLREHAAHAINRDFKKLKKK